MKNTKLLFIVALLVVIVSMMYTFSGQEPEVDYVQIIQQARETKNDYLANEKDSPLTEADKKTFKGLDYYPVDENYKVEAKIERFDAKEVVIMPTSDGKEKRYKKYAYAKFNIMETSVALVLYQPVQKPNDLLFLPFADETSALETYGSGRYLDFDIPEGESIEIDFNLAYNPYCAYSDKFSCPLPPRENFLSVAIKAGEKNYTKN